ncbi:hypothetical protein HOY80DRAFT_1061143 [Tuber brumale]|nr:hypothetical protein HOY80DRAFT_1061143 [Tuber brumale]
MPNKEEEKWKKLKKEWNEEKEELIRERDMLKRKRENILLSPRETPMPEEVKKEEVVHGEQEFLKPVEENKKGKVGAKFDPERGRGKMLPMTVKVILLLFYLDNSS